MVQDRDHVVTTVRQRRHRYTNARKLAFLRELEESGLSMADFCRRKGRIFTTKQISDWRRNKDKLRNKAPSKKGVGSGQPSSLACIEEDLLKWLGENREKRMVVSTQMIDDKLQVELEGFRDRSDSARRQTISRWLKSKGIKTARGKLKA